MSRRASTPTSGVPTPSAAKVEDIGVELLFSAGSRRKRLETPEKEEREAESHGAEKAAACPHGSSALMTGRREVHVVLRRAAPAAAPPPADRGERRNDRR